MFARVYFEIIKDFVSVCLSVITMNPLDMEFALVRRGNGGKGLSIRNNLVDPGRSVSNAKGEVIAWVFDGSRGATFPEPGTVAFKEVRKTYRSFLGAEGSGIPTYSKRTFVKALKGFQNLFPTQTTLSLKKKFPRMIDFIPVTLRAILLESCSDVSA
jgi:hypothetical protein